MPAQLIVLQLLPHLDEMAQQRRETLAEKVKLAADRLRADFPSWRVNDPEGGSVLWVQLPVDDSGPVVHLARRHGVHVAPGSIARPHRAPDPHIRICVDRNWSLVEVGLQRLELAWRDFQRGAEPVLG